MKSWEIFNKHKALNKQLTIKEIIKILLKNRGLDSKEGIDSFLQPKLEELTLDYVGINKKEVHKTIIRIKKALDNNEQIVIYGDYDVDGITGSAILWETLYFKLKAKVTPYIPHRIDEGYGLSIKGIENLKSQLAETKLIITVDNGIVANEAVEFANKMGIDVIITDHHVADDRIPNAHSIVHTTSLCGAGVAYLLKKELIKYLSSDHKSKSIKENPDKHNDNDEDNHLELAALGTIADLVPLQQANRIIVKFGLEKLKTTNRYGLNALYEEAGIDKKNIGVYEVGHMIAPRLNATGRMENAMDSLRLLCTKDMNRAHELAALLGSTNKERQNVMLNAVKHASLSVQTQKEIKKLLIVSDESYPEGVIGLVAGRLVEEFYRPAIVISRRKKFSKASVRSIKGFNIIEFLRQFSDYFVNIGGHPMAAGFTIETEKIEQITTLLEKLAHSLIDEQLFIKTLYIDCELPFDYINDQLYSSLLSLAPFGMANPEPLFVSTKIKIVNLKIIGKDGKHLKFTLHNKDVTLEAIAFGLGTIANNYHIGDLIDAVYTIDKNTWNGISKLQLKIKDIRKSEAIAIKAKEE